MVERLASFFRVNLATNPDVNISLAEEIALQTTYLEIEQTRYPDLDIRIDLPAALARAAVPAFLLQPLVENAVKQGAGRVDRQGVGSGKSGSGRGELGGRRILKKKK